MREKNKTGPLTIVDDVIIQNYGLSLFEMGFFLFIKWHGPIPKYAEMVRRFPDLTLTEYCDTLLNFGNMGLINGVGPKGKMK